MNEVKELKKQIKALERHLVKYKGKLTPKGLKRVKKGILIRKSELAKLD